MVSAAIDPPALQTAPAASGRVRPPGNASSSALTSDGRALLRADLEVVMRAATIEAGLDTNSFHGGPWVRPAPRKTPQSEFGR